MVPPVLRWLVYPPPARKPDWAGFAPGWLLELQRFRGEVLYNNGLRPAFQTPDGQLSDPNPADPYAYHIIARTTDEVVASLRVIPLTCTDQGFCEQLLGPDGLRRLMRTIGCSRNQVWEGSGWAVCQSWRNASIGSQAVAAGFAVAGKLQLPVAIGASGTRYGQLNHVLTMGYREVPGFGLLPAPTLSDDIRLVYGAFTTLRPAFRDLVDRVAGQLIYETASEPSPTG